MIKLTRIKIFSKVWIFFVVCVFMTTAVYAQSNKQGQPKKVKQKAASEIKPVPQNTPQAQAFTGSKQGYQMVTDVLDGFGGESESSNYKIPVNSGGQPSAIGMSQSTNYTVKAGYVHASFVLRGDANASESVDLADAVYLVNWLFIGGPAPCPMEGGDANCSGGADLADAVYIVNWLFIGGPPPCNL